MKIQPVILCGGGGTRLWPLSRTSYPKQLLAPLGGLSLLQQTAQRLSKPGYEMPLIISNEQYRFLVAEQMHEIGITQSPIILEPCARNTAPAMALAAHSIKDPETYILFSPSDHQIINSPVLDQAIQDAKLAADQGKIVVFGISPDGPKTGYGYILPGSEIAPNVFGVQKFVEKPDKEKAQELLESPCYWNSGIFFAKANVFLKAVQDHLPDTFSHALAAIQNAKPDLDFIRVPQEDFEKCDNISIDYGVIEKSNCIAVVICQDIGWSDIGTWQAVWELNTKDDNGNAIIGDVIAQDVKNSYIRSDGLLVSVIGLENLIIVASSDAILVANKANAEKVKEITTHLRHNLRSELDFHKRVYRPWGYYQEIDLGERFKVKRLMLKSLSKTSVQIHYHRAEHWVVVTGTAKVLIGDKTQLVHENESIYIPAGTAHSVENPGKIDLHLIEVQSGSYLGEDDIVRLKDIYGRV
ncbi:MAG: mannose-phosphate guanylyltransferase [Alphaproteobacteria bacterium]|jgi:mannose-1-phosphate guanylyltransferase/mannose-6-phosphate isomerase|nr:mannose-phosphate guanylyltransferase [Alphaproteobacteria bacterium]